MALNEKYFQEKVIIIKDKYFKYYLSPLLFKYNFKHGFFTKTSSEINLSLLSKKLNPSNKTCFLNQIHSNQIVLASKSQGIERVEADGMINDKYNQNLWIYTADCMPILFADKIKRYVAAIHCGRRGLENKIIKNIIKIFYDKGCLKENLLVAIGPCISKKNYLLGTETLQNFYKQTANQESNTSSKDLSNFLKLKKKDLISLDIKKFAHIQLLNEKIDNSNIDISNICTYESNNEFYSWRRSKTYSRQWNFISAD